MLMNLDIPPSREVFREDLLDIYGEHGENGLAGVLDEIVVSLGGEADWLVHYVRPHFYCCHIQESPGDPESRVWRAGSRGIGAAMLLAIERFVNDARGDGLPDLEDDDA